MKEKEVQLKKEAKDAKKQEDDAAKEIQKE